MCCRSARRKILAQKIEQFCQNCPILPITRCYLLHFQEIRIFCLFQIVKHMTSLNTSSKTFSLPAIGSRLLSSPCSVFAQQGHALRCRQNQRCAATSWSKTADSSDIFMCMGKMANNGDIFICVIKTVDSSDIFVYMCLSSASTVSVCVCGGGGLNMD